MASFINVRGSIVSSLGSDGGQHLNNAAKNRQFQKGTSTHVYLSQLSQNKTPTHYAIRNNNDINTPSALQSTTSTNIHAPITQACPIYNSGKSDTKPICMSQVMYALQFWSASNVNKCPRRIKARRGRVIATFKRLYSDRQFHFFGL